jgi:hypothetical protein
VIVFAPSIGGLMRVPTAGGTPTTITTLDPATGETNRRWPFFLPGRKAVSGERAAATGERRAVDGHSQRAGDVA